MKIRRSKCMRTVQMPSGPILHNASGRPSLVVAPYILRRSSIIPIRSGHRSRGPAPRHEHRHAFAVAAIVFAEHGDQVALLEPDADKDVGRGYAGEQQMPLRHGRRGPDAMMKPR